MPPHSRATGDRILDYTAVAANALRDVATAAQIPFLGRVCVITLTILPMVQVLMQFQHPHVQWFIWECRIPGFNGKDVFAL
jgi:hypothetical protein